MGQRPTILEITRAERGLTQRQLADKTEVNVKAVIRAEMRRKVQLRILVKIVRALDLELNVVLDELYPEEAAAS